MTFNCLLILFQLKKKRIFEFLMLVYATQLKRDEKKTLIVDTYFQMLMPIKTQMEYTNQKYINK